MFFILTGSFYNFQFRFYVFCFYLFVKVLNNFIYTSPKFIENFYNQYFELSIFEITSLYYSWISALFSHIDFCFLIFSFLLALCVCFYVLSKTPNSPSFISMALCSRCPAAVLRGVQLQAMVSPSLCPSLIRPPTKIQQATYRCCPYNCLKSPCQNQGQLPALCILALL